MYGPSPSGRYGHAVTMVGTKFFIFGGQVDGEFMNDLWSFDLNTCKSSVLVFVPVHSTTQSDHHTFCVSHDVRTLHLNVALSANSEDSNSVGTLSTYNR